MKILIAITTLTLSTLLSSAEQPQKLTRLITLRNQEVAKIDERFLEALEKLKVQYTKSGDLESANAVVEVITNLKSKDQILDSIVGEWSFKYKGENREYIFTQDFKFSGKYPVSGNPFSGVWKRKGKYIYISRADESKRLGKITIDPANKAKYDSEGYIMLGEKKHGK